MPRAPHLDDHGQQLPLGPHLEHHEGGGQVLLLSSDHVGRDSVQQAEVSLKQGTALRGGGGMRPRLRLTVHPWGPGQRPGDGLDLASCHHPVSAPEPRWQARSVWSHPVRFAEPRNGASCAVSGSGLRAGPGPRPARSVLRVLEAVLLPGWPVPFAVTPRCSAPCVWSPPARQTLFRFPSKCLLFVRAPHRGPPATAAAESSRHVRTPAQPFQTLLSSRQPPQVSPTGGAFFTFVPARGAGVGSMTSARERHRPC